MTAYVIASITVTDPVKFQDYAAQVGPVLAQYGGRHIVRGGTVDVVEGQMDLARLVLLEFPSMEAARAWHSSPEYAPLLALRASASISNLAFVDGYVPA
jgi:uncharacterized protein (DUF1330 family)